ncbi:MAG TPA: DEAD/DEAH box helicase, partial [Microthrixaceae bacterium]|nr:DEAD/DEAH box helicase [Microthrixaceae bacterium]
IPANRNPFTYYKRAIISIDTLKNAGRYRHHLEGIRWDAVVIDECHNLVNRGTLNNQLAQVLAPRTESLILTSATPHNGDPESFAELIRLLDPTAIADPTKINQSDIEHLYIRRHKAHKEVAAEVGTDWADRLEPTVVAVQPQGAEADLLNELADTWIHPGDGQKAPISGKGSSLFPWTLFKAAMSSHRALAETVRNRRRNLKGVDGELLDPDRAPEDEALERLQVLAAKVDDGGAAKLTTLVDQLHQIGVGAKSSTRVVVFSERIATLNWLAEEVPAALGLKDEQVRVLHGGLADVKQMDVIEEFGLGDSPVRLLLTGDMASEGVNLHRQCHHLIHFDLPWSLITIEQRNGRIDRYGQLHSPDVRALVVTPNHPEMSGDVRVLSKLLQREFEAHRAFGESGSLLGLHSIEAEEDAITKALRDGTDAESVIPTEPQKPFDLMALLAGGTGVDPVAERRPPSLFASDHAFVTEALSAAFPDATALDLRSEPADPTYFSLQPPSDLIRRLSALPQSYLSEQKITERMKLTADMTVADSQLTRARESTDSQWPTVGYLSPLHPIIDWLVDKVLVMVGRNQAPVLSAAVDAPTFCLQGVWSNGRGRPQLVEWLAVTPNGTESPQIADLFTTLTGAGVGPSMSNTGKLVDTAPLQTYLPAVVAAARTELKKRRSTHDEHIDQLLAPPRNRLTRWVDESNQLALQLDERPRNQREKYVGEVKESTARLIESLRTTGDPMIRVLAVLVPNT